VHRVRPDLRRGSAAPGRVRLLGGFGLSDPDRHIPWRIVCDRVGAKLPPFDFNTLPAARPKLCGRAAQRRLTGFDLDPESLQVAKDGTFWIGEEFGPYLLHVDRRGRLLEAPVPIPGVRAPQNATLDVGRGQRPTVDSSKGLEGLGVSPDRRVLHPLVEGIVTGDDARELRIYAFDVERRAFLGFDRFRLAKPGTVVNTAALRLADGSRAYPKDDPPPANLGQHAIGELTVLNAREAVVIERDNRGDHPKPARFKKLYRIGLTADPQRRVVAKSLLVDLLAIPDPHGTGRDGKRFRFPYLTTESVTPTGAGTLLLVNDNNFPFSNARSFSRGGTPSRGLAADPNEFIEVRITPALDVDPRLLTSPAS
jgi:hypothetical protein